MTPGQWKALFGFGLLVVAVSLVEPGWALALVGVLAATVLLTHPQAIQSTAAAFSKGAQ